MSTISKLPEELLSIIFKMLSAEDLLQAQRVCRAWYFPGHTLFLKKIELYDPLDIQLFIASIDYNPNPEYLKAVKSIFLDFDDEDTAVQFDKEKLFFRFPNLQKVTVLGYSVLFQDFNDQVCQDFIEHCPNLKSFKVVPDTEDPAEIYELEHKLRLVLTEIDQDLLASHVTSSKTYVDCIAEFPRIQYLEKSDILDTFQAILPAFDRLNIDSIDLESKMDDRLDFAEKYFGTKPKEQQDWIAQRLSDVKKLEWKYHGGLCVNSATFIDKYLVGLNTLKITSPDMQSWSHLQQQVFCTNILHSLCSAKHSGSLDLYQIELSTLSACFPLITEKVFASKSAKRILKLLVIDEVESDLCLDIKLDHSRQITIVSGTHNSYQYIKRNILSQAILLNNVDEFEFAIAHDDFQLTVDTYYEILKSMKNLKEISLDIPELFQDKETIPYSVTTQNYGDSHPLVETVNLSASKCGTKCQSLLDVFSAMFPNLKYLRTSRFCGIWEDNIQEYQVKLPRYSLECLTIDVTKVNIDMQLYYHFFIVHVDVLHDARKFTYRVYDDLSSVSRVHDDESIDREDYVHLHIVVENLQKLVLYFYPYDTEEEYLDDLAPSGMMFMKQTSIAIKEE